MSTPSSLFDSIIARAEEPSTYAGVATLLAMAGVHIADPVFQAIAHTAAAIAGLVAAVKADKAKHTPAVTSAVVTAAPATPAITPIVTDTSVAS